MWSLPTEEIPGHSDHGQFQAGTKNKSTDECCANREFCGYLGLTVGDMWLPCCLQSTGLHHAYSRQWGEKPNDLPGKAAHYHLGIDGGEDSTSLSYKGDQRKRVLITNLNKAPKRFYSKATFAKFKNSAHSRVADALNMIW